MTATEELMHAALTAPEERKDAAVRVLRGEADIADSFAALAKAEPYLTLSECSKRLNLSTSTLWRWQIPGHEFGGRRRFRLSEVVSYLEGDEFRRRAAALRAERKHLIPVNEANTRSRPSTKNP